MATTLTCTIAGVAMSVVAPTGGLSISRRLNQRSTATIQLVDLAASYVIREHASAVVSDTNLGTLFTGFVDQAQAIKVQGGGPTLFWNVTLKDLRWLADKRLFTSADYTTPRLAGDIVCDLYTNYLSTEGILALFAQRTDKDATTWGSGTLTSTSGASGALQLALAGSPVTITENTTSVWNTGILTNTAAQNNMLTLAPVTALHLTGYSAQGGGGTNNNYVYVTIWSGSTSIGVNGSTTPTLRYSIWISSTSPAIVAGIDFTCSDGTTLRSRGLADEAGIAVHPGTDLSGYANDQWYSRIIDLETLASKTISTVQFVLEGDPAGTYHAYVQNVQLYDGNGNLQTTFFSSSLQTNSTLSDVGYSSVNLSVVTAYNASGTRISPNYGFGASVNMVQKSLVSWQPVLVAANGTTTALSSTATGTNQTPYITVSTSFDGGATYQTATNHAAIANLMAGMKLSTQSLTFLVTLNVAGPDPTITPALQAITATVTPTYAATKTDVINSTLANWNSGTLANTTTDVNSNLILNGVWRNWKGFNLGSQVVWGTGSPQQQDIAGNLVIYTTGPSTDVRSQFVFAGTWGPNLSGASTGFTMDCDVLVSNQGNYGICYGTTNWNNANNTFAYEVDLTTTTLTLGRGSNADGSGSFTTIVTHALALVAGEWHHLRVIWYQSGGNYFHIVAVDGVTYINNVQDNTFTAHGYFGARFFNNASSQQTASFNNFGVVANLSGTWVSPAINISSVGTSGGSLIEWNATTPNNTAVLIEVSLNNGSTWTTCTNNTTIPGITNGTNVSGITQMLVRATLSTQSASVTPVLSGLTVWVLGQYNASGSRISPVLSLGAVGTAGATSVVWNATTPTNTSVLVDTSPDGTTWTNVSASGNPIPTLTTSPDPTIDDFLTNTSASYTQSSGTWTWDTGNLRLIATTGPGKMVYTAITAADGMVQTIMDYADSAGLVARWTNNSNTYVLILHDASSTSPNTAILSRIVGGTTTQLGSAAISFTRGTYHTPTLSCVGTTISVQFDGTQIISVTDSSLSSGKYGFHVDTRGQFYTLWVSPFGQSLTGQNIYSRVRLSSTDPTVTPSVSNLTVSVRSSEIDNGAIIPNTSWAYQNQLGSAIDDLAKKSNVWWKVLNNKHLTFMTYRAMLAPWPLASANGTDLMGYVDPQVSYNSPSYRNRQFVTGATSTQIITENKVGDGLTQSWPLGYPVTAGTTPVITVSNATQTVALQGTAGGPFDFTYTPGGTSGGSAGTIVQNAAETPPSSGATISVTYSANVPVVVQVDNTAQQTLLAALDGSSGIVESSEAQTGLTQVAATDLANARLAQYAQLVSGWKFTTRRDGLSTGQILYCFVPELGIPKTAYLVNQVKTNLQLEAPSGTEIVKGVYDVECTSGAPGQFWTRLFVLPQ